MEVNPAGPLCFVAADLGEDSMPVEPTRSTSQIRKIAKTAPQNTNVLDSRLLHACG